MTTIQFIGRDAEYRVGDYIVIEKLGRCEILAINGAGSLNVQRMPDGECFRVVR